VLDGTRQAARDVATITFDDGYRDVYAHAFPVMRDPARPGVVYVPSVFVGTDRRLGHDRLFTALRRMRERGIGPMAVGAGQPGERWLIDVLERESPAGGCAGAADRPLSDARPAAPGGCSRGPPGARLLQAARRRAPR